MKRKIVSILHLCAIYLCFSIVYAAQVENPLDEAAKIQKYAANQDQSKLSLGDAKEKSKKEFNGVLQSLFYRYYEEVKRSGIKLDNAQKVADNLSYQRRQSGGCCEILIASRVDGGMYVTTSDGNGLFAIDGYGLQSVNGVIRDEQYKKAGVISAQCKYEVSLSYRNSRVYDCAEFLSRKIDGRVVADMMNMLPVAMRDYSR